jgi:uncharacterized protein (TIGR01777 family)
VNVAGDAIDKRWTEENKKGFHASRVGVTDQVVAAIAALPETERPKVLVNASAVGYYGDRSDEVLDEASAAGEGYLAQLCEEWEGAAVAAEALGVRVVQGRIGVVLGKEAEAWKRMKTIFQLGGGGKLGDGQQFWPWVHLADVAGGMVHALESEELSGAMNLTGPEPLRNIEFTKKLAAALHRPAILPVPGFALRIVFGGFASALLASQRVRPGVLLESGYDFRFTELRTALEDLK